MGPKLISKLYSDACKIQDKKQSDKLTARKRTGILPDVRCFVSFRVRGEPKRRHQLLWMARGGRDARIDVELWAASTSKSSMQSVIDRFGSFWLVTNNKLPLPHLHHASTFLN
jgi:hypothetical protein